MKKNNRSRTINPSKIIAVFFSLGNGYKYNYKRFAFTLLFFASCSGHAACNNCNQNIELNINEQLSSSGNTPGYKFNSSNSTVSNVEVGGGYKSVSFSDIYGNVPDFITTPTQEYYQKLDDYFSIAIYSTNSCGTMYHPSNRPQLLEGSCKPDNGGGNFRPETFHSKLRIDKTLVGGTYFKHVFIGRYGVCIGQGCSFPTDIIATVYVNYNITVPQNCVINSGQVVSVDFGNIPSTAFKSPGQIAERVAPITRQITMQCSNIEPFRNMSVRVQANSVSGNAIVSNNEDVGFVLGDSNRREITPNQPTSTIPFMLSGTNTATVPVTIWPVSTTGKKPVEGRVSAIGFLRIDFD